MVNQVILMSSSCLLVEREASIGFVKVEHLLDFLFILLINSIHKDDILAKEGMEMSDYCTSLGKRERTNEKWESER